MLPAARMHNYFQVCMWYSKYTEAFLLLMLHHKMCTENKISKYFWFYVHIKEFIIYFFKVTTERKVSKTFR